MERHNIGLGIHNRQKGRKTNTFLHMYTKLLLGALLALCMQLPLRGKTIKVACVGNSITYGAGIANREQNSYPAQLQSYLGNGYEVKNFGVSGRTLLKQGDLPYVETGAYKASQEFAPDVVFVKLGTNDSKPQNRRYADRFKETCRELVRTYRALPSHPRVILLTPLRCFLINGDIDNDVIRNRLVPLIREVAYEEGVELIDLYPIMGTQWDAALLPDRLHPSAIGAGRMARLLGEHLLTPREQTPQQERFTGKAFNFYGHKGVEFTLKSGEACKVVMPERPAPGRPWVLRARFWGHEPQTDIALLERGFHIAYCDVADLYGSPEATARWDRFYRYMTRRGMSRKVVLEGMSRGGLIVYNWAARHPKRVACIYADAPVMDLKSWPMGCGHGEGSETDVERMLEAYGWKNRREAMAWQGNPTDHAARLAAAGVRILHVVGSADRVVPVDENTDVFAQHMALQGGNMQIIRKKGVGHHPHSLYNPAPIVRFVLKATGLYINPCTRPVCGNEYRSGAGWAEGAEWHRVAQDIDETLAGRRLTWLWLGNSITQGLGGNRKCVTYKIGKDAADKALGTDRWETAGISGDRTENLLWRIEQGGYDACQPDEVVVAIGVNNLIAGDDAEDVAQGIRAVALAAKKHFGQARIHVLGLLPAGHHASNPIRRKYGEIHRLLKQMKWDGMHYVDPTTWFTDNDGRLRAELYAADGIHLTPAGYEVWCEKMKQLSRTP